MDNEFTSFRKYPDIVQAEQLEQLLIENNIECILTNNSSGLDSNFSSELLTEYEVKVRFNNFKKAEHLVEELAEVQLNQLPDNYYLLEFTDEELYDIVVKKDEWNEFDYLLALKLLKKRGQPVDDEQIKELNNKRITELAKPEKDQTVWIAIGYTLALFGGFLGLITGYVLWTSDKTLPNGEKVYTYSERDRKHGRFIVILSIVVLLIFTLYRIF